MGVKNIDVLDGGGVSRNVLTAEGALDAEKATAGAPTSVAGSASSVQLIAAGTVTRDAVVIYNDSNAALRYALGFTASSTAFTGRLDPFASVVVCGYTGAINGIWDSATGNARITELT